MKKNRIFSLIKTAAFVYLVCISSLAGAQGDKFSFRMRGMGQGLYGLVDDLYSDLSLNPAFIYRYQGTTLFSNISNLQGKTDQRQFNQEDAEFTLLRSTDIFPSNIIGTITEYFGQPMGLFWESQGYNITLSDEISNESFFAVNEGTLTGNRLDLGSDFSGQSISWIGLVRDFGISLSYHRLGFDLNFIEEDFDRTFTVDESTGLRENNKSLVTRTQRNFNFPNSMFGFSVGKVLKRDNSEISISAGRRPERVTFNANDLFGMFKDPFVGGGEGKLSSFEAKDLGFMQVGLKSTYVNLRYKQVNSSLDFLQQNNFLFKYERFSLPISIEATEEILHDSLAVDGALRKQVSLSRIGITKSSGDGTLNNMEFGAGIERHVNNFNTMIALGAKFNYLWGDLDFAFSPGRVQEVLDIRSEIGDPGEESEIYSRIISDNREKVTRGSINGMFLSLPVGLETKISDNFTLRLGARSVIPFSFKTEWETETTDGVDELIETTEETTSYSPEELFPTTRFKKMDIDGKSINLDSYHFGASYRVNNIITVDLLHFAKITELDTWWLSIVLNY
ncbi:hypothetical protein ACFL6I_08090 [candidate division KSB1 bacterium]